MDKTNIASLYSSEQSKFNWHPRPMMYIQKVISYDHLNHTALVLGEDGNEINLKLKNIVVLKHN